MDITSRPQVFEVEVTSAGSTVAFDMPANATHFAMKLKTTGGALKWSHTGTEGEALADPSCPLDEGEGFSMPDIANFTLGLSDIYFDDNGGTLPCTVVIVVS